jgi:hypothetical protein
VCERRSFTNFKNARCFSIDFLLGCLAGAEQINNSAWNFLKQEIPKLIRADDPAWVHLLDYGQLSDGVMNGFRKTIWQACTQEFDGSPRGQQQTMDLTVSPQQSPRKLLNFVTDFENLDLPPASYQGSTGLAAFNEDETPNLPRQMEQSILSDSTHGSDSTFTDPEQANDPFSGSVVPSTQPHAAKTGEQAFLDQGEAHAMQQELNTLRENEGKVRAHRTALDNRSHAIEEQKQQLIQQAAILDERDRLAAEAAQAEREGLRETIAAEREVLARDTEILDEQFRQVQDERQQQTAISQRLSELSEQQRSRSAEANQALAVEKQNLLAVNEMQEQVASRQVNRELAQDAREQNLEQRELASIPESEAQVFRSPPPRLQAVPGRHTPVDYRYQTPQPARMLVEQRREQAVPGRHTPVGTIPSTPQQGIILAEKLTPQHLTASELRRRFPSPDAPRLDLTPVPQRIVGGTTALPTPMRTPTARELYPSPEAPRLDLTPHRRESLSPGTSEFSTVAPDSPSDSPIERPHVEENIAQGLALRLDHQDLADIVKTPSKFHTIVSDLTEETGREIDPTKLTEDIVAELQRPSREYTVAITPPQGYGGPAGGEVGTPQPTPHITSRVRGAIVTTPPNLPARSALVLLNRGRTPITEDSPRQGPTIGADFYQRLENPATPPQRQQAQMLDTGEMRAALGTEEYE